MLSLEGKQLGNYDVIRRIRVGGMGAVYEGRQRTAFDRRVAIKVILGNYAGDREMRRRFAREARTVARLHHPHILPLIEFGDEQGLLYLVMPFIDGGTLTSYLRRSLPDLGEVAAIYQQLLDAVEYAHEEGLIHRDIKSSNVLLELRRSGPPYVYLADFGLVRTLRQSDTEQVGKPIPLDQVPGTPHYMAPEQTRSIVTPQTDIYALGVLLYQLLTGELPYNDPDDIRVIQMHLSAPIPLPSAHDSSIPRELDEVVRKAMAKRQDARYKTVAELRQAFLAAVNGPIAIVQEEEPPTMPDTTLSDPSPSRRTRSLIQEEPLPIVIPNRLTRSGALQPLAPPARPSTKLAPLAVVRETHDLHDGNEGKDPVQRVRRGLEPLEKPRITENVKNRTRTTEEPVKPQQRPTHQHISPVALFAAIIVPAVLIILLIMPHVLGFSFFPSGFPVFGTPPVATIFITAQSKSVQDKYVLTASPQVKTPDLNSHTIPAHGLKNTASDRRAVPTTGSRTVGGVQARGTIELTNNTKTLITVPAQTTLTTAAGIQFQTVQDIQIPPRTGEQPNKASVAAIALVSGVSGNIAPFTLNGPCCGDGITARNNAAFSGGIDPQVVHVVSQADLDSVRNALLPNLQHRLDQQLQKQLTSDEISVGKPRYSTTVSADNPVGTQADQVQVTITSTGSIATYNRSTVSHTAVQLLDKQAEQTLGKTYKPQGAPSIGTLSVVGSTPNGIIYLSVPVHGTWVYALSPQQMNTWPQYIKGATSAAALAYLSTQPGVAGVEIRLPFGADHLPTSMDDIRIVLVGSTP